MADSKDALSARFGALLAEVRANRKLQYGLLAIAAIIVVELGLSWSDSLSARERRLQELRTELRQLRGQSRDEAALKAALSDLENRQTAIEKRLWVVPSAPVGQAKLKDWLTMLAKNVGAKEFKLVLSAPKAIGGRGADKAGGGKENAFGLREFRADIGFTFTPEALERMLYAIEGGETLASVESLSIVLRTRKAEVGVRVIMRLGQPTDAVDAASAVAKLGEAAVRSPSDGGEKEHAESASAAVQPQPASAPEVTTAPVSQEHTAPAVASPASTDAPPMPAGVPPMPAGVQSLPEAGAPNEALPVPGVPPVPAAGASPASQTPPSATPTEGHPQ